MAQYFFHVRDGSGQKDESGKDFPDHAAARVQVEQLAITALATNSDGVWRGGGWSIDVTDEEGMLLFALHLFSSISPKNPAAIAIGSCFAPNYKRHPPQRVDGKQAVQLRHLTILDVCSAAKEG